MSNPYVNPQMIATAVKITPRDKEDLKNYKIRSLSDSAILYEGYCVLPHNCIEIEKLVPDLVRDEKNKPILDDEGKYSVVFRKAFESELETGNIKEDYLKFIEERRKELGYSKSNNNIFQRANNHANNIVDQVRMEKEITNKNFKDNFKDVINKLKTFFKNIGNKRIEGPINNVLDEYKFKMKNPMQDKKIGEFIAKNQAEYGLEQIKLKDAMKSIKETNLGSYLLNKYFTLNNAKRGIHGKEHSDRVTLTSLIIANEEGVLNNDNSNRLKDILINAAYYHDIGRIADFGPHAKRSARIISKMDLKFLNGQEYSDADKKLLMAIVESHVGKPEGINDLIKKYGIINENDQNNAKVLSTILRDADALDRARVDIVTPTTTKVNLKPEYLKTNTAKRLILSAYELENLTNKKSMESILTYIKNNKDNKDNNQWKENIPNINPTILLNDKDNIDISKDIKDKDDNCK